MCVCVCGSITTMFRNLKKPSIPPSVSLSFGIPRMSLGISQQLASRVGNQKSRKRKKSRSQTGRKAPRRRSNLQSGKAHDATTRCASTQPQFRPSRPFQRKSNVSRPKTSGPGARRLKEALPSANSPSNAQISVAPAIEQNKVAGVGARNHISDRALQSKYVKTEMAKIKKCDISQRRIEIIVDGLSRKNDDEIAHKAKTLASIEARKIFTALRSIERAQEDHDAHEVKLMDKRTTETRRHVRALAARDEEADSSCHERTAFFLESRLSQLRSQSNQLGLQIKMGKQREKEKIRRNKIAKMLAHSQVKTYKPHVRKTIEKLCHGDKRMTRLLLSMSKKCEYLVKMHDKLKKADSRLAKSSHYTPTLRNMLERDTRIFNLQNLDIEQLKRSLSMVSTKIKNFEDLKQVMVHASKMGEERLDAIHTELSINRDERLDAIRVRLENFIAQRKLKKRLANRERQRIDIKQQAMIDVQKSSNYQVDNLQPQDSIVAEVKLAENILSGKKIMEDGNFPSWDELQKVLLERTSVMVETPQKLVTRMLDHASALASLHKELARSVKRKNIAKKKISEIETELRLNLQEVAEVNKNMNHDSQTKTSGSSAKDRQTPSPSIDDSLGMVKNVSSSNLTWDEERRIKDLSDRLKQKRTDVESDSLRIRMTVEGIERLSREGRCACNYLSGENESPIPLKRRRSTLNFMMPSDSKEQAISLAPHDKEDSDVGNKSKDETIQDTFGLHMVTRLNEQKIIKLRDYIPALFAHFLQVVKNLNRKLLLQDNSNELSADKVYDKQKQNPALDLQDKNTETKSKEADSKLPLGPEKPPDKDTTLIAVKPGLPEQAKSLLSPFNVRVQSALAAKEITAGERRQQCAILRTRVLRELRTASMRREQNRLLRSISLSLHAEQDMLLHVSMGDSSAHGVASLRQEDENGNVVIRSAELLALDKDDGRDSEDEDFEGQRASMKLQLRSQKSRNTTSNTDKLGITQKNRPVKCNAPRSPEATSRSRSPSKTSRSRDSI